MNDELYINGNKIELSRSNDGTQQTVIAMSFQVNDLAELADRQANYSNQFTVPKTDNNRLALGFSDNLNSNTAAPYRLLPAKLVQSGCETVPNGISIIEESASYFSITLYSGIFDFFSKIDGLSIRDLLTLDSLNHTLDSAHADSSRGNTSGYIYPIIQTGQVSLSGNDFELKYQLPSIYVHTLIDKIFEDAGFEKSGLILDNDFYKSLVIPCQKTTAVNSTTWIADRTSVGARSTGASGHGNSSFFIENDVQVSDGSTNNYNPSTYKYVADQAMFATVSASLLFRITVGIGAAKATITIIKNGVAYSSVSSASISDSSDTPNFLEISDTLYLIGGDEVEMFVSFEKTTDIADYNWSIDDPDPDPTHAGSVGNIGNYFKITPTNEIAFGSVLNIADYLPNISQKDLIKAVLGQMFGSIFQANNLTNVLDIRQFKEIPANKTNAKNWTSKLDLSTDPIIKYRIGSYGQINNLLYKVDQPEEDITNGLSKGLGNGKILINDATLPKSVNLFELPFAASPSQKVLGNTNCAVMTRFELGVETKTPEPRILSIRHQIRDINYINYDGSSLAIVGQSIPVAYFIDDTQTYNLGFENNLKESNLKDLEEGVLKNTKDLTAFFNLNVNDIQNLDFFTPVFLEQYNEYFYINLINEFLENKSTECELIRL